MEKSRSRKTLENTIAGFVNESVVLICGFILPRLILRRFGSTYNGITSSISQFISCIVLLRSGIGGVTKAALYKPLAEKNTKEVSEIILQTEQFMRKVAVLFLVCTLGFAAVYPFIVPDFSWFFTFSLYLIIAFSTFVQYYFGLTYQMLLNADQRQCVISILSGATTVLNTLIAAILIYLGFGIHAVKLGSTIVFSLNPIFINIYVRKKYKIDRTVAPRQDWIRQRWDAMGHVIANFVNSNADVIILTLFVNVKEVSVYTVYYYVINGIKTVTTTLVIGFGAAFGNMLARKEYKVMHKNLGIYEIIVFSTATILYTTTLVMLVPFALLYTSGVEDINYRRPLFSLLITIAGAFNCYRLPYQTIVTAAGHYKQTRNGALMEAAMNIVLSVSAVFRFGLAGVAFGTLVAAVFRTFQYGFYLSKNILPRSKWLFVKHILLSLSVMCTTALITSGYMLDKVELSGWIFRACITFGISVLLTLTTDVLFFREDFRNLMEKLPDMLKRNGG